MQFAGTEQLAALGPTSLIFNFSSYVFNALGIATTSVVSTHLAQQDLAGANEIATSSLAFALVCGFAVLLLLQVRQHLLATYGPCSVNVCTAFWVAGCVHSTAQACRYCYQLQ